MAQQLLLRRRFLVRGVWRRCKRGCCGQSGRRSYPLAFKGVPSKWLIHHSLTAVAMAMLGAVLG